MNDYIIFYSTGCPKCAVLKKKLDAAGLSYETCDDVKEMTALGLKSAPNLNVNGTIMDFGKAIKWLNEYIAAQKE